MDTNRLVASSFVNIVEMGDGRAFIELEGLCLMPKDSIQSCLTFISSKLKHLPELYTTIKRGQVYRPAE